MKERSKLFEFVTKLIRYTKDKKIFWSSSVYDMRTTEKNGYPDLNEIEVYVTDTNMPEHKKMRFIHRVFPESFRLELLNDDKVEFSMEYGQVNTLEDLYRAIKDRIYAIPPEAEQIIDLFLKENSEISVH